MLCSLPAGWQEGEAGDGIASPPRLTVPHCWLRVRQERSHCCSRSRE